MRRNDRQVTDKQKINEIIMKCQVCRLGFSEGRSVYIVPLNFGYDKNSGTLYFHGAAEGKKIELIKKLGFAGFEMDTDHKLKNADKACNFSYAYQSVIGDGEVSFLENPKEKAEAFNIIMSHYTNQADWQYDEKVLKATVLFKLKTENMTCKFHG